MNRFTEYELESKELTPIVGYWAYRLVPLEEALAPFMTEINELRRSISEARKHCHYPSEHGLTREESAALFLYTMEAGDFSFYRFLNTVLRQEDRNRVKPWFPFLKLFDTAINKLPIVKGNIWRGVCSDVGKFYKDNETLTWWNVSSCSLSTAVVESFLSSDKKSTLFMIEAVNGRNLAGYTAFPNEKEVILNLGTKLRVKSNALKYGNLQLVHLIEIDNNGDEEYASSVIPPSTTAQKSVKVPSKYFACFINTALENLD